MIPLLAVGTMLLSAAQEEGDSLETTFRKAWALRRMRMFWDRISEDHYAEAFAELRKKIGANMTPELLEDLLDGRNDVFEAWTKKRYAIDLERMLPCEDVFSVKFSPDGKTIAAGAKAGLIFFDATNGAIIKMVPKQKPVVSVDFSPNGQQIVVVYGNNVSLIDVKTGFTTVMWGRLLGNANRAVFSPDGRTVALGTNDKDVRLINTSTSSLQKTFPNEGYVYDVKFSPDGKKIAAGSSFEEAVLIDIKSGHVDLKVHHEASVVGVAFSPDGKMLATSSDDCDVKIVDLASKEVVATIHDLAGPLAFSPESRVVVTASKERFSIIDVTSGLVDGTFQQRDPANSIAFQPNGRRIAIGSDDGVRIYSINTTGVDK